MKFLYTVFLFFLLIITSCDTQETSVLESETHIKPTFVTELFPVDDANVGYDVSQNVIQGIASFEDGWFVTQRSGTTILLINYLDKNGVSLYHQRMNVNSHGQDLSIEKISDNKLFLYTSKGNFDDNRKTGLLKLEITLPSKVNTIRNWSQAVININTSFNLNYTNATPTINNNLEKFAIRSSNSIYIHDKTQLESANFLSIKNFNLNSNQLIDNGGFSMWFQGIEMKDNQIFCLTGNAKIGTEKKIFSYNEEGTVLQQFIFDRNDVSQSFYDKLEPEGLTFKNNELYFTLMTKKQSVIGNIKYMYKITL